LPGRRIGGVRSRRAPGRDGSDRDRVGRAGRSGADDNDNAGLDRRPAVRVGRRLEPAERPIRTSFTSPRNGTFTSSAADGVEASWLSSRPELIGRGDARKHLATGRIARPQRGRHARGSRARPRCPSCSGDAGRCPDGQGVFHVKLSRAFRGSGDPSAAPGSRPPREVSVNADRAGPRRRRRNGQVPIAARLDRLSPAQDAELGQSESRTYGPPFSVVNGAEGSTKTAAMAQVGATRHQHDGGAGAGEPRRIVPAANSSVTLSASIGPTTAEGRFT
jgi:hypothetical protein